MLKENANSIREGKNHSYISHKASGGRMTVVNNLAAVGIMAALGIMAAIGSMAA